MQMIHKLRIARFVAEQTLSEEQRYLVNYHTEYMLFRDDKKETPFNASRYTDHRADDTQKRDARISLNVKKCINKLDPSDEMHKDSYQATYKAIMGRNRASEERHAEFDSDGEGNNQQVDDAHD